MDEQYVKRSDAADAVSKSPDIASAVSAVNALPAADVSQTVRGEWECRQLDSFRKFEVRCSVCGWTSYENYDSYNDPSEFLFCPNCGAEMDV